MFCVPRFYCTPLIPALAPALIPALFLCALFCLSFSHPLPWVSLHFPTVVPVPRCRTPSSPSVGRDLPYYAVTPTHPSLADQDAEQDAPRRPRHSTTPSHAANRAAAFPRTTVPHSGASDLYACPVVGSPCADSSFSFSFLVTFPALSLFNPSQYIERSTFPSFLQVTVPIAVPAAAEPLYGPNPQPNDFVFGSYIRLDDEPENAVGIDAAFLEQNEKGGIGGRMLRLELPGPSGETNQTKRLLNFQARITSEDYVGIVESSTLFAGDVPKLAGDFGLPVFSPHVLGDGLNLPSKAYNKNIFHLSSSVAVDIKQLINYATRSHHHVQRFMFVGFDVDGVDMGTVVQQEATKLGLPKVISVSVPLSQFRQTYPLALAKIDELLNATDPALPLDTQLPQAIIYFTGDSLMELIVNKIYQHPKYPKTTLHMTTHLIAPFNWKNSSGSSLPYGNVYHAMSLPHYDDTQYASIQKYRAAMDRLYQVHTDPNYRNMTSPYTRGRYDYSSLYGYFIARVAIEALLRVRQGSAVNKTNVIEAVRRTRSFQIDDLQFGPFSFGCVGAQTNSLAACWCNTGQRQFFSTKVNPATGVSEPIQNNPAKHETNIATVDMTPTVCGFDSSLLRPQAHVMLPTAPVPGSDGAAYHTRLLSQASERLSKDRRDNAFRKIEVFPARVPFTTNLPSWAVPFFDTSKPTPVSLDPMLPRRYATRGFIGDLFSAEVATGTPAWRRLLEASFGQNNVSDLQLLNLGRFQYRWPEADPAVLPIRVWQAVKLDIPVYPVLADLAHAAIALAQKLGHLNNVHVIADTASMASRVVRSIHTFGAPGAATTIIVSPTAADAGVALPTTGTVVVVTQSEAALRVVQQQAAARAAAGATAQALAVVLATSEFVLEAARDATSASTAGSVLRYVSGLRTYGAFGNASTAYGDFMAEVIAGFGEQPTSAIPDYLFSLGRHGTTVGAIGPLSQLECPATASGDRPVGSSCQCSKGINEFTVRPLAQWEGTSSPAVTTIQSPELTYVHAGCGVEYKDLPSSSSGLSNAAVIGIAAGGVVAAAGAVVAVVLILQICVLGARVAASRKPGNAPQDQRKPFTMVFTDIQASTTLWAHAPQHMGEALDAHHTILRELVAQHKGFEVKTIGDAFMVAFKQPWDAVHFGLDVQRRLFAHEWGSTLFDGAYREQLLDAGILTDQPATAWHGLRVRVGVHTGTGDIKVDAATGGYDYYGTVVNTAARVEAVGHGGQVLLTDDCVEALGGTISVGDAEGGAAGMHGFRSNATYLGLQPLRGLEQPVGLMQLVPEEFGERSFPPLRLDHEAVVDEGESSSAASEDQNDDAKSQRSERSVRSAQSGRSSHARGALDAGSSSAEDSATLEGKSRQTIRRLHLKTAPAGLAFAYRLVETMLSTATPKARATVIGDAAKRWRVPQPLPKWARIQTSDLAANAHDGGRRSSNVKSSGQDKTAGQLLFTLARVLGTLEAMPAASRPQWVGGHTGHRVSKVPDYLGVSQNKHVLGTSVHQDTIDAGHPHAPIEEQLSSIPSTRSSKINVAM